MSEESKSRFHTPSRSRGTGKKKRGTPLGMTRGIFLDCNGEPQPPSRLVVYFCDVRNFVTSRAVGIEGWAPLRVTEMAATAEA